MRDTELYQTLLGLTPPWEVTAVNITQSSADRPLGEVAVTVRWRANAPFLCPNCRGHDYVSGLHDVAGGRVLDVVPERTREAADTLCATIPEAQRQGIAAVAKASIVDDKFHCARELNRAVDLVRRREHRLLQAQGHETLTQTKYLWLKNPRNWTERQRESFQSLKIDTLKAGRAWAIKEAFTEFWDYRYTVSAKKFFDRWYFWATHSRLTPIINAAKTLKRHPPGLLAYTKHRITNAIAEGTKLRAVPHRHPLSLREA